jgi:hypothetical protein
MAYTAIDEKAFRSKGGSLSKKITTELALIEAELTDIQLLKWKQSVKCATTGNDTLATAYANGQSVDGYTLVTGDRILIKDQTDQTVRGIYTVNATGAPTRAVDMNAGSEFPGAVVAVENGTVNADSAWVCTNDSVTLTSTNIVFAIFGGLKAGNGLTFTADVASIDTSITADLSTAQTFTSKTINQNAAALPAGVTGTPVLKYGDIDTAVSYLLTASFVPWQVKVSAGGAITGTLGASYFSTATGIALAATGQLATCMVRTTVSHNLKDAYGMQSHLTIGASMGTTSANAHLTAISGKITLSATPTVSTGWANAGLFIIEGAGSVTQMCHVVSAVCEAGVTAVQSLFHAYTDSTVNAAFQFNGTTNMTHLFDFDAAAGCVSATDIHIDIASSNGYIPYFSTAAQAVSLTGVQALTNKSLSLAGATLLVESGTPVFTFGSMDTPYVSTKVTNFIAHQVKISQTADIGTGNTLGAMYARCDTGIAQTGQIATSMVRTYIAHNIFDAYGMQSHMSITASMATVNANAHLTAISGKVTFTGTPTVSKGWVTAGLFIIEGAGTVTQMCHGVSIVEEAGSTGAQSLMHLNTDVGTTPYLSFSGADGTGKSIYTHTAAGTQLGTIMILVNGVQKWIPFMQAE